MHSSFYGFKYNFLLLLRKGAYAFNVNKYVQIITYKCADSIVRAGDSCIEFARKRNNTEILQILNGNFK
jgi:hypothetical protein